MPKPLSAIRTGTGNIIVALSIPRYNVNIRYKKYLSSFQVFDTPEGPKHVLVGVVSFGPAVCGTGNLPGIYVSIPYFLKWVLEHIIFIQG